MAKRVIYEVYAKVVDTNGSYNTLDGYPKVFDSKHYGNDTEKTRNRAEGAFHECIGAMCKVDTRQVQSVIMMTAEGNVIYQRSIGRLADLPDSEVEA